jgi:hypothetical protein
MQPGCTSTTETPLVNLSGGLARKIEAHRNGLDTGHLNRLN